MMMNFKKKLFRLDLNKVDQGSTENGDNNTQRMKSPKSPTITPLSPNSPPTIAQSETEDSMDLAAAVCHVGDEKQCTFRRLSASSQEEIVDDGLIPQNINDTLSKRGYKIIKKMSNTLQGEMYEADIISHDKIVAQAAIDEKQEFINIAVPPNRHRNHKIKQCSHVVIKRSHKILCDSKLSYQDEMNIIVEENIVKEAIILYHLTVENKPTGDFLCEFVNFFETESDYFLVMRYAAPINLTQFITICHQYIKSGQLKLKEYKRITKYLSWQLVVAIHWLHNDMHCCHLDLSTSNILINNGEITANQDGTVSINPKVSIKLGDFGLAECFKATSFGDSGMPILEYFEYDADDPERVGMFHCIKTGITETQQHKPPKVFQGEIYDARRSDIFSLGIVLFKMAVGVPPYRYPDKNDFGFLCIEKHEISEWLKNNNLSHYMSQKMISVLQGMLHLTEPKRFDVEQIMTHQWLSNYYQSYGHKIIKKSKLQRKRNMQRRLHKNDMDTFPYYRLPK